MSLDVVVERVSRRRAPQQIGPQECRCSAAIRGMKGTRCDLPARRACDVMREERLQRTGMSRLETENPCGSSPEGSTAWGREREREREMWRDATMLDGSSLIQQPASAVRTEVDAMVLAAAEDI